MQPTYILQINTAFNEASIGISKDGELIHELINTNQYDHASFLQPAIIEVCNIVGIELKDLSAVSVMNGPGSYTGLRVGLSSGKGICYALGMPLICINTLDWMSFGNANNDVDIICPMIDARRNEVYTGLYNKNGEAILQPTSMILDENSFSDHLSNSTICFVGNGAPKCEVLIKHTNAIFPENKHTSDHFSILSYKAFIKNEFQDLAYAVPFYIKAFYSTK